MWHVIFKEEYYNRKRLTSSCCKNSKVKPKGFRAITHGGLSQKTCSSSEFQSCKNTYLSPIKFFELNMSMDVDQSPQTYVCIYLPCSKPTAKSLLFKCPNDLSHASLNRPDIAAA